MSAPQIVAILTEQGVNLGDHGQDITRAIVIDPEETVGQLAERVLTSPVWKDLASVREPDGGKFLTLRLAVES